MPAGDYRDMLGGFALLVAGAFAALYSLTSLDLGSVSDMGPGMFPAALGSILAVLGAAILIPAMFRDGEVPSVDLRSLLAILAAIIAFALMIRPFGLIPAVALMTVISSRADSKLSVIGTTAVAAVLSLGATLIFRVGLELPIVAIRWPW